LEVSDGILIFVEDVWIDRNKNAWKTSLPTCLTKSLSPLSGQSEFSHLVESWELTSGALLDCYRPPAAESARSQLDTTSRIDNDRNAQTDDSVLPSWVRSSPKVDAPRRNIFSDESGISYSSAPRKRSQMGAPSSSGSPSSSSWSAREGSEWRSDRSGTAGGGRGSRFGMRSDNDRTPRINSDRSMMTPKETKAFNSILNGMYKDHTGASTAKGAQSVESVESPESDKPERVVSAPLGYLDADPADSSRSTPNYNSAQSGSSTSNSNPSRTPRPVKPTMPAHEMEQATYDEFDRQKEIISGLGSDLEVWEWARENVFQTPSKAANLAEGETGAGQVELERKTRSPAFPASYSLVLAYLIKVFRDEFKNPHLALSAFTLARSHSIQSYVSGCSTAAYNEALETYWKSFRNLRRVEECVKEMSVNGVGWDRNTSRILSGIIETLSETQLSSPSTQFGAGQRCLEAEFGTEVLIRLGALEKRVEADVRSKEKGVRMLLGQLAAERRKREAASRPAVLPEVEEEERWGGRDDGEGEGDEDGGRWEDDEEKRGGRREYGRGDRARSYEGSSGRSYEGGNRGRSYEDRGRGRPYESGNQGRSYEGGQRRQSYPRRDDDGRSSSSRAESWR
jgi:hypothetical protein